MAGLLSEKSKKLTHLTLHQAWPGMLHMAWSMTLLGLTLPSVLVTLHLLEPLEVLPLLRVNPLAFTVTLRFGHDDHPNVGRIHSR